MDTKVYNDTCARQLLSELGIEPHYKGYQATLYALDCIAENKNCLTAVMKEICIPVSERLRCEFATVEAEIRRSSERAWRRNSELLIQISPYKLTSRPTVRQFLNILYAASCTECQLNEL